MGKLLQFLALYSKTDGLLFTVKFYDLCSVFMVHEPNISIDHFRGQLGSILGQDISSLAKSSVCNVKQRDSYNTNNSITPLMLKLNADRNM